jgi:TPR repeat protein
VKAGFRLGLLLMNGQAVKQDQEEGLGLVKGAAEKGDPDAAVALGRMYLKGEGVPRDPYLAAEWFVKSDQKGLAADQFELGQLYEDGTDAINPNIGEAMRWYAMAAHQGYQPALEAMDRIKRSPVPKKSPAPPTAGPTRSPKDWKAIPGDFKIPPGSTRLYFYDFDARTQNTDESPGVDFWFKADSSAPDALIGVTSYNGAKFAPSSTETPPWDLQKDRFMAKRGHVPQGTDIPCITSEGRYCTFRVVRQKNGQIAVSFVLYYPPTVAPGSSRTKAGM